MDRVVSEMAVGQENVGQRNKELVLSSFERIWNKGDLGCVDEVYTDDFRLNALSQNTHSPGVSGAAARREARAQAERWLEGFPDLRLTVDEQLAEGDFVASRHTAAGTQARAFMGLPNTGRHGMISGITISRVRGDRISEMWTCWDAVGMMQQLGILPSAPGDVSLEETRSVFAAQALLPDGPDTVGEAKAIVRRFYDEVWNAGRLDVVDDLFVDHFVGHAPGGEVSRGPGAVRDFVADWRSVVPDVQIDVHQQVGEGARVATRFTGHGTHQGAWLGIPPTGKEISLSGISITRVVDGRFVSEWGEFDVIGLLRQLGVVETPE
jgi:steroid delta-isomerase-like uncharacterized protein